MTTTVSEGTRQRALGQLVALTTTLGGQRSVGRLARHLRVLDLPEALDQALPLLGLEDLAELLEIAGGREAVADVDVVVVVRQCEGRRPELHQGDDLRRAHRPLQEEEVLDHRFGDRSWALIADDRYPVDGRDVDGRSVRMRGDVP